MHAAATSNRKVIAELLIANGAEVNAQADSGRTPLDYALYSFKTRELLRKHGGKTMKELEAAGVALPFTPEPQPSRPPKWKK